MRGTRRRRARPQLTHVVHVWLCTFVGVVAVSVPTLYLGLPASAHLFLTGSFGATAILLYASPRSDLAQPRNLFGGHLISAFIGVSAHKLVGDHVEIVAALAVATAIAAMLCTDTLHPPGGAIAMIAVIGGDRIHDLGYGYLLSPVLFGAAIMFVVAVVLNNLSADEGHQYPATWW